MFKIIAIVLAILVLGSVSYAYDGVMVSNVQVNTDTKDEVVERTRRCKVEATVKNGDVQKDERTRRCKVESR